MLARIVQAMERSQHLGFLEEINYVGVHVVDRYRIPAGGDRTIFDSRSAADDLVHGRTAQLEVSFTIWRMAEMNIQR
jgi:hypothetical protein